MVKSVLRIADTVEEGEGDENALGWTSRTINELDGASGVAGDGLRGAAGGQSPARRAPPLGMKQLLDEQENPGRLS